MEKNLMVTIMSKKFLSTLAFLPLLLFARENRASPMTPVKTELQVRMPEWRPNIVEQFQNGSPRIVVFYCENEQGIEEPIKKMVFFENGHPMEETDLISVDE
ncbi:MAG: hypothetical protein AAGE99_05645 [Chlamydiota bacterium]